VGGVLVERTVQEVLPSVKQNRQNLEQVLATMQERLNEKQKESADFRLQNSIVSEA
jgi:prefoldin subunit 5